MSHTHFDKHLASHWGFGGLGRRAVNRHGLPVSGELQCELLFHQLLHHLFENEGKESTNKVESITSVAVVPEPELGK